MTRYQAILGVIRDHHVSCQWWCDKRIAGEQEGNIIRVNPKMDVVPTIIHEAIHLLFPEVKEKDVVKAEENLMKRLTKKQCVTILRAFVKKARP